jgi:multicomponent Na+:H+ antiporter subunit G
MRQTVAELLILSGVVLILIAAIGLHRFDDVFARIHAASKASSLGFLLIVAGGVMSISLTNARAQLVLAGVLIIITTPVGVHMLARAAYRSGGQLAEGTVVDELAQAQRRADQES